MFLTNSLVFFLLSTVFLLIRSQNIVDLPCTVKHNGARGVCKVDTSCPKAIEDGENGISPTICGFLIDSIIVVCCEGAQATNVQAHENSLLNTENRNSDGIVFAEDPSALKASISEQKCLEYNKDTVTTIEVIPLVPDPPPSSYLITNCSYDGLPLIIGGSPALPGEFPFTAILGYAGSSSGIRWKCGGTLISDFFVMTAAHCISSAGPVVVRLGELDLSRQGESFSKDFGVADIKRHPDYNHNTKFNDIALIKLARKVTFNRDIRPACLWNQGLIPRRSAIAAGWGATEVGGKGSDTLLKVSLDILEKSHCDRTFGNIKYFQNGLPNTMLCAGILRGGMDTCQGDSGGPLVISKEDNRCIFYIIGVTSFGRKCALENTPAVYTRVSKFVPWIEEIVWG